jgi:hypothetical protein
MKQPDGATVHGRYMTEALGTVTDRRDMSHATWILETHAPLKREEQSKTAAT